MSCFTFNFTIISLTVFICSRTRASFPIGLSSLPWPPIFLVCAPVLYRGGPCFLICEMFGHNFHLFCASIFLMSVVHHLLVFSCFFIIFSYYYVWLNPEWVYFLTTHCWRQFFLCQLLEDSFGRRGPSCSGKRNALPFSSRAVYMRTGTKISFSFSLPSLKQQAAVGLVPMWSLLPVTTGQLLPTNVTRMRPHSIQPPLLLGLKLDPAKLLAPARALTATTSNKIFWIWSPGCISHLGKCDLLVVCFFPQDLWLQVISVHFLPYS